MENVFARPPVVAAPTSRVTGQRRSLAVLLASFGLVALVAWSGGALTNLGLGPWYDALVKPKWNPPPWVFAPVWTTLYVLLAVGAWLVAREPWTGRVRRALALHVVQLAGQVAWSGIFFAARRPLAAAVEIVFLVAVSFATAVSFARIRREAGLLLVPYLLWVSFAAVLNWAIALAN